jgi:carbonic anhydrase
MSYFHLPLTQLESLLQANKDYARTFNHGKLVMPPARNLAILACMDARLTVEDFLGLQTGDAHIIRNAGGIATDDAIRSLIISHELLGTKEFLVINHTDCGMLTFSDRDLQTKLRDKYKADAGKITFHAFDDLTDNVKHQVKKIRTTPFIPEDVPVHGFVYHVENGSLEKIV